MRHSYSDIKARVERVQAMIGRRARRLSSEAGLDPELLGIHPHNAMVSYRAGRPWRGVDYGKVRKVIWLADEYQWRASRLLQSLYEKGRTRFDWESE